MAQGLNKERIEALEKMGYIVHMINDQPPCLYAWLHPESGASQRSVKLHQPYRLSADQAWADCDDYVSLRLPSTPNPDWRSE